MAIKEIQPSIKERDNSCQTRELHRYQLDPLHVRLGTSFDNRRKKRIPQHLPLQSVIIFFIVSISLVKAFIIFLLETLLFAPFRLHSIYF